MKRALWWLLPGLLWADVGGLQRLPDLTVGPPLSLNGDLETGTAAPDNWILGPGWNWVRSDPARCRSGSGPNCLAVTNPTASSYSTWAVTVRSRFARFRAWLRTEGGDPGANARFYLYVFDQTHGQTAFACGGTSDRLPLSGGLPNWTQYTLCDGVIISHLHYGDAFHVRAYVLNLPAGVTLYLDDFTVEPVQQSLVLFPLYPNYRGMLWPDQGATIKWDALVEPPAPEELDRLKVVVDVVQARDGAVLASLEQASLAPVAASGPQVGYSVNPMSYDASALADGAYYLRGKLVSKADGRVLYTYPDYKIVKEQPAVRRNGWKIWIDKDNRTVIRGKPRFIYGAYFSADTATTQFVPGAADCCRPATADDHRKIALGCVHKQFKVENIANGNPAIFTVRKHNLKDKAKITLSGAAGAWLPANGCYYWIGCPHGSAGQEIQTIDADRFSAPIDTTSFGPFAGQDVAMVRAACYEDDTPLTSGDTSFGIGGSSLIRVLGRTGMNTIIRYGNFASASGGIGNTQCETYGAQNDSFTPWLTALQDVDAWHLHIVNHYYPGNIPMAPGWWGAICTQALPTAEAKVRWMINRQVSLKPLGNTDGFMGLYVADEPSEDDRSQGLAMTFAKVNEFNSLGLGGASYWASTNPGQTLLLWNNIVDAHGADPYPVGPGQGPDDYAFGFGAARGERRHGRSYAWPRLMSDALFDSRPNWTVIQLFTAGASFPTLADHKIQIVSALAAGSHGILWWQLAGAMGLSHQGQAEYLNFERASKVIVGLMDILAEPIQDLSGRQDGQSEHGRLVASISAPEIRCASRQLGARILLACANTTNAAKTVTIRMTNPVDGDVLLPWTGAKLPADGKSFTMTFKGLLDAAAPEDSVHLFELRQAAVVNSASFQGGPVAPGELLSIFSPDLGPTATVVAGLDPASGTFPTLVAGTRVWFDQFPAPLLLVSPRQINGAVPYALAGQPSSRIRVEQADKTTVSVTVPVADAAPGLFTADASGAGRAAAFHPDWTANAPSNPAARGSVVVLYATGGGLTQPPGVDGKPAELPLSQAVLPLSVRIGDRTAQILYQGASPGLLTGILQINVLIPDDAPIGDAVPVTLTVGNAESQRGVTLAIR